MHRMGVMPEELDEVVDVVVASSNVELEGLYTHLSVADGPSAADRDFSRVADPAVRRSRGRSRGCGVCTPAILHCANSAGALGYPTSRHTMVRVGLSLYGYLPEEWLAEFLAEKGQHLTPALALRAQVSAVRRVAAGARPSYGRLSRARRATPRSSPCPLATPTDTRGTSLRVGPRS